MRFRRGTAPRFSVCERSREIKFRIEFQLGASEAFSASGRNGRRQKSAYTLTIMLADQMSLDEEVRAFLLNPES